jgi:hypothetical protein
MLRFNFATNWLSYRAVVSWVLGSLVLFFSYGCGDQKKNSTAPPAVATNAAASDTPESMNKLSDQEETEGWKLLFDGSNTDAWRGYNQPTFPTGGWVVTPGGLLMMEATGKDKEEEGYGGDIITKDEYQNFEFKLDYKLSPDANGGILYLVKEIKGEPIWHSAPEYQLLDDAGFENRKKYVMDKHRTGDNFDLMASTQNVAKPVGEWNEAMLKVKDGKVEHWLNGQKVLEYTLWTPEWKEIIKKSKFAKYPQFGMAKKGHIGIQDWGHKIWYRNIKVRDLSAGAI